MDTALIDPTVMIKRRSVLSGQDNFKSLSRIGVGAKLAVIRESMSQSLSASGLILSSSVDK